MEHGRTGLLFAAGDCNGLANAIATVETDEQRRSEMGAAARDAISRRNLTWMRTADQYLQIYRSMVSQHSNSGRT